MDGDGRSGTFATDLPLEAIYPDPCSVWSGLLHCWQISQILDQPAPPSVEVGSRPYLQQALPATNSRVVLALHHG